MSKKTHKVVIVTGDCSVVQMDVTGDFKAICRAVATRAKAKISACVIRENDPVFVNDRGGPVQYTVGELIREVTP